MNGTPKQSVRLPFVWEVALRLLEAVTLYCENGVTFIRSQNVTNAGLLLEDTAFIDEKTHERIKASEVLPFDVLLNITGASIGR